MTIDLTNAYNYTNMHLIIRGLSMLVTLDFVSFKFKDNSLKVLLTKRENKDLPAFGEMSIQGGMVWEAPIEGSEYYDENLEDAASRILNTRLGAKPAYVEQINAKGSNKRDSRGWSVTLPHIALLDKNIEIDVENHQWVDVDELLKKIDLPFDHNVLVENCFNVLRNKAKYTSILLYLLGEKFTISQAVDIFSYFNLKVSKQTVHNRWVKSGLLEETGEHYQPEKGGKPAALYKLAEKELSYFDISIGNL